MSAKDFSLIDPVVANFAMVVLGMLVDRAVDSTPGIDPDAFSQDAYRVSYDMQAREFTRICKLLDLDLRLVMSQVQYLIPGEAHNG